MEFINRINQINIGFENKPILKFMEIINNQFYKVLNARIVDTMYGTKLMLEFEDNVFFMPKQYSDKISIEDIEEAMDSHIIYMKKNDRNNLEFKIEEIPRNN